MSFLGRFAKGHIPSIAPPSKSVGLAALVGALATSYPASVMLPSIPGKQGSAGACTGWAFYKQPVDTAARIAAIAAGQSPTEIVPASALAGYVWGRCRMLGDPSAPLQDGGCDPFRVVDAAMGEGIARESDVPYDLSKVNDRLPLLEAEKAHPFLVTGASPLAFGSEDDMNKVIQPLIAAGFGVPFAMPVDQSYEALSDATVYEGPTGPSLGNHAQFLSGYTEGTGSVIYRITGSWTTDFAAGGFAYISSKALYALGFDFSAIRAVPRLTA